MGFRIEPDTEYGRALMQALLDNQMSATELARKSGVSQNWINRAMNGIGEQDELKKEMVANVLPELAKFSKEK